MSSYEITDPPRHGDGGVALVRVRTHDVFGDFADSGRAWRWFLGLVLDLPYVTFLGEQTYIFPNGGLTGVVLLAESHAAIHTWPEHGYAWVELVTCGDPRALDAFSRAVFAAGPGVASGGLPGGPP